MFGGLGMGVAWFFVGLVGFVWECTPGGGYKLGKFVSFDDVWNVFGYRCSSKLLYLRKLLSDCC